MLGGLSDDTLIGNRGDDEVIGAGGNVLRGWGDDDSISFEEGFDTLEGGDGKNRLLGDVDSDSLNG